ncbi:MAG: O-methyltransferase [Bacilli bacterium]|nr:O-methyltransferase [Bacilli bacterium]
MDRLEEYAIENNIPIMQKDGILFLTDYIKKHNIKSILEIGSAIGYSAIKMAKTCDDVKIVTIERDVFRYNLALKNIKDFGLNDRIEVVLADALDVEIQGLFDLIFIDAAKAQYIKFFEKFKSNLKDNGVIISDNLNFHGLSKNVDSIKSKNLKALVKKINNYRTFLQENKEFKTEFLEIGDGIAISKKA